MMSESQKADQRREENL